jgi:hypothetical protein
VTCDDPLDPAAVTLPQVFYQLFGQQARLLANTAALNDSRLDSHPTHRTVIAMTARPAHTSVALFILVTLAMTPARASLFKLAASGTVSFNSSSDSTLPVGTPWALQLIYDTAAPDLDAEFGGSPDPTFGNFNNTASPPALRAFHYQAGEYEVTIDDPASFGTFSGIHTTFTTVNALDVNINAPSLFPPLAGGAVSFHADFNAFSMAPIFANDGLPTNTALSAASFDQSSVTLLPPAGAITGSTITSLTLTPAFATDFDDDGGVDGDDLVRWQSGFGTGLGLSQGDADGDGRVDGGDFLAWQRELGSGGATGAAAVPEPGAIVLAMLLLAGKAFAAGRKRAIDRALSL